MRLNPGEAKEFEIEGILYHLECYQCDRCAQTYNIEEIFYVLTEVVFKNMYKSLLSGVSLAELESYLKELSDG